MRLLKLALGLLGLSLLCLAAANAETGAAVTRKIVVFPSDTPAAERVRLAQAGGGRVVRSLDLINALVVETPAKGGRFSSLGMLEASGQVVRVDEDPKINWLAMTAPASVYDVQLPDARFVIPHFTLSKPLPISAAKSGTQEIPWGIARVNAPAAWSVTRGKGVKVCVIDTGIDRTHVDLKANIAGGWNAITKTDDFTDDNGHGSHVTGTIAAVDDDEGVVGVAPEASIYGVKVLDADGSGTFDDVIAGMQWAVDHHMQIASMSLGASKGNDSLKAAVEAMVKGGVALVAAAGNSGAAVGYPAAYPGAIAVAAMDSADKIASFSSRGPEVAVAAPGVDVHSTYMNGGYATLSGTSMATPHVSGLAALAIAAKGLSGEAAVRAALRAAAVPLPGASTDEQGAGVPDALKLVR